MRLFNKDPVETAQPKSKAPKKLVANMDSIVARSDKFTVRQRKEVAEILFDWESNNKYEIFDEEHRLVCFAVEQTNCCSRMCCKSSRAFNIKFIDHSGTELVELQANLDCCGQRTIVDCPVGREIGQIDKPFSFFCFPPTFKIRNTDGDTLFKIPGTCQVACGCTCCRDIALPVISDDGEEVALITKEWAGCCTEWFTDAETFSLEFVKRDMKPSEKILILASVFPVDFHYFEKSTKSSDGD